MVRNRRAAGVPGPADGVEVGDLRIDVAGHQAEAGGVPLRLTRKEFALLALLARTHGRVMTHRALLAAVWGTDAAARTDTLRVHVTQLRKKLGTGPQRPRLVSDPGVGYRLVVPEDDD